MKVLNIVGLGRSGSTILDLVLGNHPRIESVGEVGNLARNGWVSRGSLRGIDPKRLRVPICTCGRRLDVLYVDAPGEACPFWSEVRREWVARADPEDVEAYPRLRQAFESKKRGKSFGLNPLLRLLWEGRRPSAAFRSYAALTRAFFESIRAVSGKPVVVDSSKSPVRAFAFGMVPGVELYAVHLVRDGRGVMASHRKTLEGGLRAGATPAHEGRPPWRAPARRGALFLESVVRWVALNLAAEWVCNRLGPGRAMRLRYEDFAADPEGALGRIGSLVGLDLTELGRAAASGEPMQAGHNVGGNRTKKSGTITLRADEEEWRGALSPMERRLSWLSMGWLMRRYGYHR